MSELTMNEAADIAEECYKVLFARFKLTADHVEILRLTKEGSTRERRDLRIMFDNKDVYKQQGNIV